MLRTNERSVQWPALILVARLPTRSFIESRFRINFLFRVYRSARSIGRHPQHAGSWPSISANKCITAEQTASQMLPACDIGSTRPARRYGLLKIRSAIGHTATTIEIWRNRWKGFSSTVPSKSPLCSGGWGTRTRRVVPKKECVRLAVGQHQYPLLADRHQNIAAAMRYDEN